MYVDMRASMYVYLVSLVYVSFLLKFINFVLIFLLQKSALNCMWWRGKEGNCGEDEGVEKVRVKMCVSVCVCVVTDYQLWYM